MSLSEHFINKVYAGDSFLCATTALGEVFFIDDSLESVQINRDPIDSLSVCGSKIFGLSKDKLTEWSTAGLNKLSFNKENKMLVRQDF